ncbi:hypothetical protein B0H14DRAFT_2609174 [Mycena olivaceomarginata]|nr:hypothetical protein B0H14DRAFT_2609174 [Mycena olivaceomarginata]
MEDSGRILTCTAGRTRPHYNGTPCSVGGNSSDVDSGEEDEEPAARRDQTPGGQADAGGSNAEGAGEDEEEGSADTDGEEIATRVAQMNELLAIQSASTREYEDDF